MQQYTKIILPTRPQPDTIVAIFLLKTFGVEKFPGIDTAKIEVHATPKKQNDTLLLDVGGGVLDHHGTDKCATELVAEHLGVHKNPALRKLIQYAARDDKHGKGTLSRDPIDRTFGLSGLTASLNKQFPDKPEKIINIVLPLLQAHYHSAVEHFHNIPKEIEKMKESDKFTSYTIQNGNHKIVIACIVSDNIGMVGYLRSGNGGGHNVVVQKTTQGHVNILTKQTYRINLSQLAAMLRLREAELLSIFIEDEKTLYTTAFHPQLNMWYYDPATNSVLNGGAYAKNTPVTKIPWEEIKKIVNYCMTRAEITK